MRAFLPLLAVIALIVVAFIGVETAGLHYLFGVVIPYLATAAFVVGLVIRVLRWARSPVPFRIPTTAGQEKSLPWIKQNKIDNPSSTGGVITRMLFEVLLFRSLFRNTKMEYTEGPTVRYTSDKWLWLFGLLFHYAFLVVLLRHLRFFTEPVLGWVKLIESLDGFLEITLPTLLMSGIILLAAVGYLFVRRIYIPQVRYISLPADYFPLFLIMGIATTGILMRYLFKVDVVAIKEMVMGLAQFSPKVVDGIGVLFYIHLFLVSVLFAYFPYSKLVHMGGVFLSPTRNLANTNRYKHHENPWNYPVKVHSYAAYEDEFRDLMVEAGIPVDKMPEGAEAPAEEAGEAEPAPAEASEEEPENKDSGE